MAVGKRISLRLATSFLFCSVLTAGDYGSMVNERVGASNWEDGDELGNTWVSRNAFRCEAGCAAGCALTAAQGFQGRADISCIVTDCTRGVGRMKAEMLCFVSACT